MKCSCCGEERELTELAALQCHQDVKVCGICVDWLQSRLGRLDVTPILPVTEIEESAAFYEAAGFEVHVYEGGGFAFVRYDGASVFDLDLNEEIDVKTNGAGCYVITATVEDWHARLSGLGYEMTPVEDMPWGMREFALTDPSGNHIRFGYGVD